MVPEVWPPSLVSGPSGPRTDSTGRSGVRWFPKWPSRLVRGPGGTVPKPGLPICFGPCSLDGLTLAFLQPQPLLCGGAAWPTSPYTTLWIPGGSHFLGPPNPLLMAHLPRADCTHVCTSPPRRNQGWAWGLQVGCPRTCAQGHPR